MSTRRIVQELRDADVTITGVSDARRAPQVVTYAVQPTSATMALALRQTTRLQAALRMQSPPRLYQRSGYLYVEVPRKDRCTVPLAAMRAGGLAVDVGIAPTGKRVTLDLRATPHALVAGQTGSGKSVALRAIARGLALHPDACELVLVDLDGDTWAPLAQAAALRHEIADTPLAARRALADVQAAMDDGLRERPLVCVVDEAQMLDAQAAQAARDIAGRGRKAGVHLVLATQYVRGDVLDRRMTGQLPARLVGRMQDSVAGRWAGASDAHTLTGAGDMIASLGGRITRVQIAYASAESRAWRDVPQSSPRPAPEPIEPEREIPDEALRWCAICVAKDGDLPGINRIASTFGIGNTKATRWQEEAREALSRIPSHPEVGRILPFRRTG